MGRNRNPVHPGRILQQELLDPKGISQYRLAKAIGVDPRRINAIILEKRSITADTALRLARYFGMTPEFWMNLQARFDLLNGQEKIWKELEEIPVLRAD